MRLPTRSRPLLLLILLIGICGTFVVVVDAGPGGHCIQITGGSSSQKSGEKGEETTGNNDDNSNKNNNDDNSDKSNNDDEESGNASNKNIFMPLPQLRTTSEKIRKEISVNLLEASKREVVTDNFLELIKISLFLLVAYLASINPALYGQFGLANAVRRYEHCWLPLQASMNDSNLVPPEDAELVWHAHMLSPYNYRQDSVSIAGFVIDHRPKSVQEKAAAYEKSIAVWENICPNEPFDGFHSGQQQSEDAFRQSLFYKRKSSYDLVAAVKRQKRFADKVLSALSAFSDSAKLEKAVERYLRFLQLIQAYSEEDISGFAPSMDIDLVWHTHQLHPLAYNRDCLALVGYLIDHNDDVEEGDLEESGSLSEQAWQHHFNEPFIADDAADFSTNNENAVICATGCEPENESKLRKKRETSLCTYCYYNNGGLKSNKKMQQMALKKREKRKTASWPYCMGPCEFKVGSLKENGRRKKRETKAAAAAQCQTFCKTWCGGRRR